MVYLKDYMKKVVKYLEENDRAGEVATFKTNINKVMVGLLGKFKDLQFFTGRAKETFSQAVLQVLFLFRRKYGC